MEKLRVMHVLNTGGYSGAENVVITLINSMKDDIDFVYVSPKGSIETILQNNNIAYYPLESLNISNLKKAIKDYKPDIIHAHDFTTGVVSAFCVKNIPIINHLHQNAPWIQKLNIKSFIYSIVCHRFDKVLTVSQSVIDESLFANKIKHKSHVIGNPMSLNVIRDKSLSASDNDLSDVMFLGRLEEPKNPLMFVDIIAKVKEQLPNVKAIMVGDGSLRNDVENKIKDLNLLDNITLYGFKENPYGLLNNTKVVCMPSLWEGFGLAAVEALSLGKPVVSSSVGGLVNIVDETCGRLCSDTQSYSNEIVSLLNDMNAYKLKVEGAYQKSKVFDNIDEYKNMILKNYYEVKEV